MSKKTTEDIIIKLLSSLVLLLTVILLGLALRLNQLQEQVDNLDAQVKTYRVLVDNLYGEDGG